MDFITGLPISTDWKGESYDSILVIIDYLTKMIHYEPVKVTIDALGLAKVILAMVVRHHGLPDSIVLDKGSIFTSKFWSSLCYFLGIKRRLLTASHPQTDGQRAIEQHDKVVSQAVINYEQVQINIGCTGTRFGRCTQTVDLHGPSAKEVLKDGHATAVTVYASKKNFELHSPLSALHSRLKILEELADDLISPDLYIANPFPPDL